MQNNVTPIIVNKEGVSDNSYKIVELYSKNGSWVQEGELILCFETSKTAIDIESPVDGHVFFNTTENDEVAIGQVIAVIAEDKDFESKNWFGAIASEKKEKNTSVKISKPAQRLLDEFKVDLSVFKGNTMITKQDVQDYLSSITNKNKLEDITVDDNALLIYGGGGHAKMCIDVLKQTQTHSILGVIDDNLSKTSVLDVPVLGAINALDELIKKGLKNVVLGVGGVLTKDLRKKIFIKLKHKNVTVPTIVHPSASIEPSVKIGEGCQIMQGAIIGSNVTLGDNCIINSGCIISHDTVIEDHVHIAPGAIIGGGVTIKENTIIGMGCTVFLGLTVGKNVIVQNGINVFRNIKDGDHIKKDMIE